MFESLLPLTAPLMVTNMARGSGLVLISIPVQPDIFMITYHTELAQSEQLQR